MDKQELNSLRSVEDLASYQKEVRSAITALNAEHAGLPFPNEAREEFASLKDQDDQIEKRIVELKARENIVRSIAQDPKNTERADERIDDIFLRHEKETRGERDLYDLSTVRINLMDPERGAGELRSRAMRVVEKTKFPLAAERAYGSMSNEAIQTHVARLLERDENGELATRILTTGSPAYKRAFGKSLLGRPLSTEEQRALSVGTGAAGGFAVVYTLDPTVIPISNFSVNPYRSVCSVETIIGTNEWRGLTATGIVAAYAAEGTEASDNSPTFAQPALIVNRAQAFVPASIELTIDWGGLEAELARNIQDAKDDLEATQFATGNGTPPNPSGMITGATNTVTAGGVAAFAIADLYALEIALPPRFRPRAAKFMNRFVMNKIRQFDTAGGSGVWTLDNRNVLGQLQAGLANVPNGARQGNVGAAVLGYPVNEATGMASALTTGSKIIAIGDPNYYKIVDRIGMNLEVIPHLFGAANRFPTGQRGFFAYWRNNAKVLDPAAFRVLVTG